MGTQKITMTLVLALDDTSLQIKRKIVMPVNLPPGTYQATVEVEPFGAEIVRDLPKLTPENAKLPATKVLEGLGPLVPDLKADYVKTKEQMEFSDRQEALRAEATRQLNERSAKTSAESQPAVAQTPNNVGGACETTSANLPARKRKKRGVVLETPSQVKEQGNLTSAAAEKSANADTIEKSPIADIEPHPCRSAFDSPVPKEGTTVPETVTDEEAPPSGMVAKPVPVDHDKMERVFAGKPTAEEEKEFKARLSKYVLTPDGILEKAGMRPMEGFGGVHKQIRLYVNKMYPEVDDLKKLTKDQWSHFLATLDLFFAEGGAGAKALIEHIHRMIGAAA